VDKRINDKNILGYQLLQLCSASVPAFHSKSGTTPVHKNFTGLSISIRQLFISITLFSITFAAFTFSATAQKTPKAIFIIADGIPADLLE
jgi:hypothetical protein